MRRRGAMAAWLAILAISLNALWPLVAQAKPRSDTLVPVCTVGGETHYMELEADGARDASASHLEHCAFCPLGAAALPSPIGFAPSLSEVALAPAAFRVLPLRSRPSPDGAPRGPPFSLSVVSPIDGHWRKNEEAIALRHRGARDAHLGGGILRRGVLLD